MHIVNIEMPVSSHIARYLRNRVYLLCAHFVQSFPFSFSSSFLFHYELSYLSRSVCFVKQFQCQQHIYIRFPLGAVTLRSDSLTTANPQSGMNWGASEILLLDETHLYET